MFPTCSFYVEDTAHVCFKNSRSGRWGGDVGEGRGNKCKHVCNSAHANSHGEVTDRRPFKKKMHLVRQRKSSLAVTLLLQHRIQRLVICQDFH